MKWWERENGGLDERRRSTGKPACRHRHELGKEHHQEHDDELRDPDQQSFKAGGNANTRDPFEGGPVGHNAGRIQSHAADAAEEGPESWSVEELQRLLREWLGKLTPQEIAARAKRAEANMKYVPNKVSTWNTCATQSIPSYI